MVVIYSLVFFGFLLIPCLFYVPSSLMKNNGGANNCSPFCDILGGNNKRTICYFDGGKGSLQKQMITLCFFKRNVVMILSALQYKL